MLVRLIACAALAGTALTAPAAAQQAPAPAKPTQARNYDPNERVCETVTAIGSRLAKKRTCASRAELADKRLQERQETERIQSLTGSICSLDGSSGKPVC